MTAVIHAESLSQRYRRGLVTLRSHYPNWRITRTLDNILEEIIAAQTELQPASSRS